uniref:Uncharacterized protein n=1 Tax=Anopheles coluzzii TaxID=1518534 RepID=A0A6E8VWR7_ANOCL
MITGKLCACFVEGKKFPRRWATKHKENYLIRYQYQSIMKKRMDRSQRNITKKTPATHLAALD